MSLYNKCLIVAVGKREYHFTGSTVYEKEWTLGGNSESALCQVTSHHAIVDYFSNDSTLSYVFTLMLQDKIVGNKSKDSDNRNNKK